MKKLVAGALTCASLMLAPIAQVAAAGFPVGVNPTPPLYTLLSNQGTSGSPISNIQGGAYIFEVGIDAAASGGTFGGGAASLQIANSATGAFVTVASCSAACTVSVPQVGQGSIAKVVLGGTSPSGLTAKLEGIGAGLPSSVTLNGNLPGFATPPPVTVNSGSIAISNTPTVAQQDMTPIATAPATASGTELFRVDTTGYAGISFQPTGTFSGTITFSGSNDPVCSTAGNFGSIGAFSNGGSGPSTTTTGAGVFIPKLMHCIRAVVTTYASGTVTASAYLVMLAPVGTSTVTAATGAIAATTSASVTGLSVKTTAGNLYSLNVENSTTAGFVIDYDATAQPASGATLTAALIRYSYPIPASGALDKTFAMPMAHANGIQELCSSSLTTFTQITCSLITAQAK